MIILLLLTTVISFLFPVVGLTIYLLAWTGLVGLFEKLGILGVGVGQLRADNFALLGALTALLCRRTQNNYLSVDVIRILLLILTGTIFFTFISKTKVNPEGLAPIISYAFFCLFFYPLYVGFKELKIKERIIFKRIIIILSTITGFILILVVVTDNPLLYVTFCLVEAFRHLEYLHIDSMKAPQDLVVSRINVPGLWHIVPLGFWLSVKELLSCQKKFNIKFALYAISLFIMTMAIIINLSRGMILAIVTGSFTVFSLYMLRNRKIGMVFLLSLIVVGGLIISVAYLPGLQDKITERMGDRITIDQRSQKTFFMKKILLHELPILGVGDDRDLAVHGDAYTFIRIWWDYGIVASMCFYGILLIIIYRLINYLKYGMWLPPEIYLMLACLTAYWIDLQWQMFSGATLRPDWVFINVFFFSEVFFLTSQLNQARSGNAVY